MKREFPEQSVVVGLLRPRLDHRVTNFFRMLLCEEKDMGKVPKVRSERLYKIFRSKGRYPTFLPENMDTMGGGGKERERDMHQFKHLT